MCCCRDVKEDLRQLGPGETVLYTWQDPLGKRELIWQAGEKKNQKDDLVKVCVMTWSRCVWVMIDLVKVCVPQKVFLSSSSSFMAERISLFGCVFVLAGSHTCTLFSTAVEYLNRR